METNTIKRRLRDLCLLACLLSPPLAVADSKVVATDKGSAPVAAGSNYYWYDGGKRRQSQLAPDLLADFGSSGAERSISAAAVITPLGGPRIYRLNSSMATMKSQVLPGTSPVFRDNGGHGRMRALPGNVVVQFDAQMTSTSVADWALTEGLVVLRKLSFGNYYLIESPAGLASLELANRLQESGSVLSAQPNWWAEVVTR